MASLGVCNPDSQTLSRRQRDVMRFLRAYRAGHGGVSPTLEEIAAALHVRKVTVHEHVLALEAKGLVVRKVHRARSLRPVETPARVLAETVLEQFAGDSALAALARKVLEEAA